MVSATVQLAVQGVYPQTGPGARSLRSHLRSADYPPVGSVTSGKLLHFSEPVSLSAKWVDDNTRFKKLLED